MPSLLVKNAEWVITMDAERRRIRDGGLYIRDHVIEQVGPAAGLPAEADRVIDARGMIVLPGLINTHHHLFQTLTRAVPAVQDATLFQWLKTLYGIWERVTPEAIYSSALIGMAELMLSGCTTTSDHLYLYPNGCRIDDEIRAAQDIGIRFHAARGSMSLGESRAACPRTAWSKTRIGFLPRRAARSSPTTTPHPARCCASWLRPVRRFP